jgi:hypothetical protein
VVFIYPSIVATVLDDADILLLMVYDSTGETVRFSRRADDQALAYLQHSLNTMNEMMAPG